MKKHVFVLCVVAVCSFVFALSLCISSLTAPVFAYDQKLKIVLDAGHGGVDGGVTGKKTGKKESEINLAIVNYLKIELEEAGFEVVLTRKTNAGLYGAATDGFKRRDMQKRKQIIEETDPALVLSVHQNFYPSSSVRGGQVFFEQGNEGAERLAQNVQNGLNALYKKQGAKPRNSKTGEYYILSCGNCPSVIVECGFLSNEKDEVLLVTKSGQKKISSAIFSGILGYFSENSA